MSPKTDSYVSVSRKASVAVCCLFSACVGVAMCMALYGLLLIPHTPDVTEENAAPLEVEETVLFYQPEEYADLTPLADVPAEFEYIYEVRYMA